MQSFLVRSLIFCGLAAIPWLTILLGGIRRSLPFWLLVGMGYLMAVSAIGISFQGRLSDSTTLANIDWLMKFGLPFALILGSLFVKQMRFAGTAGLVVGLLLGGIAALLLLDLLDINNIRFRF